VRIELFGIARSRAGTEAVEVSAVSLGEALRRLEEACPGLAPEVIEGGRMAPGYLASRNGLAFLSDPSTRLEPDDTLLILGAQVGG